VNGWGRIALVLLGLALPFAIAQAEGPVMTLVEAAARGDANEVAHLIASGAPLETRDAARRTSLLIATRADHVEVARQLSRLAPT
jgi:hypothetical protein